MNKYYPEFHRLFKGNIVEVCEGRGTSKDPCRLVYYVHDELGNLLGRLDTLINSKPNNTEQYFCQSYYDDNGKLKSCTCGKCK